MTSEEIASEQFLDELDAHEKWSRSLQINHLAPVGQPLIIKNASIANVTVRQKNIHSLGLWACRLREVTFEDCNLAAAEFLESVLEHCVFRRCQLQKADFRGCSCSGCQLIECDLTRAEFNDASLQRADLTGCRLNGACLLGTDLRHAVLTDVSFKHAMLEKSKMYNDKKYTIGSWEGAVTKDIDFSPAGDGTTLIGAEIIELISTGN